MDYSKMIKDIIAGGMGTAQNMDHRQMAQGLGAVLPQIFNQLHQNARDPQERASLNQALLEHQNDPIENPQNYIENFDRGESERMVSKIFGNRAEDVQMETAKRTGLSNDEVKKLLLLAAPLVIAHLAKAKKQNNLQEEDLAEETRNFQEHGQGLFGNIKNMLDKDGDGNIFDDLLKF